MEKEKNVGDVPIAMADRSKGLNLPLVPGQILVIGIVPREKDGRSSFTLHGIQCFSDYHIEVGAYGYETVAEWTNRVDLGYLNAGDIVEPVYGKGYQNQAILLNCRVVGHLSDAAANKADVK